MEKDNKLDVLRVLSMFFVIVIHVANYYGRSFHDIDSISYLGSVIFNTLARISVPIFFMISGSLLLNKKYDNKKYFKRILEKLITLIVMTIIYYFWDRYFMGKSINILNLINEPERKLLWFLYAIIGIYIVLPFIKNMVDNMNKFEDILFISLWLIFNGVCYVLGIKFTYQIPIITGTYYLGYFVIGHIIYKYKDKINFKKYNIFYILGIIIPLIIIIYLTYTKSLNKNTFYTSYLAYKSIFMMIMSISSYLLIYFNISNKPNKIISNIASKSFGIYLIHGIILDLIMKYSNYTDVISFIGIPIYTLIIFIVTYVIVFIIHKIPYMKRLF